MKPGFKGLWRRERGVSANIAPEWLVPVPRHDRLQHVLPLMGAVHECDLNGRQFYASLRDQALVVGRGHIVHLAHTVVLLSLSILPCMTMMVSPNQAQEMDPAQAAQHLAQAREADAKCRHLSAAEHEELGQYVARAEIAAAGRNGAETAMAAIRAGHAAGRAMTCGAESERLVRAALDAARETMAVSDTQPIQEAREGTTALPRAQQDTVRQNRLLQTTTSSIMLGRFAGELMAYNLERRCRHLRGRRANDFWRRIVARQEAMISTYGSQAVALAASRAEAAATAYGPCGRRTAALIKATYKSLRVTEQTPTARQTQ